MKKKSFFTKFAAMIMTACICTCLLNVESGIVRCRAEQYNDDYVNEYIEEDASGDSTDWKEAFVTTEHSVVINGKTVNYTATVGKMPIANELGEYELYFNAFTKSGVKDVSKRPITFVFNGGPGSSSIWLNIGGLGPQRVDLDKNGMIKNITSQVKDNKYSILDMTDLVFIDPVGTGFSCVTGDTDATVFYTFNGDCYSIADFIRLYISAYDRWTSPKYLAGESYGTVRAVGVCQMLQSGFSIALNGIMLVSSANDYAPLVDETSDNHYVNYIPSYAATAWYHNKLDKKYQNMKLATFLKKVKKFASSEYLTALYQGNRITDKEKRNVAKKLSKFIGLSEDVILGADLRVDLEDFCAELLADNDQVVGRYDGRYTGPVSGESIYGDAGDPSILGLAEAFVSAYIDYISSKLKYKTLEKYEQLSKEVINYWNFGAYNEYISQEEDIKYIMTANSHLKVWVVSGYYDLATPFYGTEWVFSHIQLADSVKKNLSFTYYKSGHMFYVNESSLKQFHKDAVKWFSM